MEREMSWCLLFGQPSQLGAYLALEVALSVPYIKQQSWGYDKDAGLRFPEATKVDIKHLEEYILKRFQIQKKINCPDVKQSLYLYVKKLDTHHLVQLTKNACRLYPKEEVPEGLLDPLVEKMSFDEHCINQFSFLSLVVQEKIVTKAKEKKEEIAKKICKNKKLLQNIDENNESIITSLIASYSKALNKSISLQGHYQSLFPLLSTPVVEYIYIGNSITVFLSGTAYQSCPHCNYTLAIQTKSDVKTFTLSDKTLDFHDKGSFASKDETFFACPYSDPYGDALGGLCIVNLKDNTTRLIECPYKACFFDDNNKIHGFDKQGNRYSLDSKSNVWCKVVDFFVYRNIRKLILFNENNDKCLMWSDDGLYIKDSDNVSSLLLNGVGNAAISDVIIDSQGKRICIKTLSRGIMINGTRSSDDYFSEHFLYDCCDGSFRQIGTKIHGKSFASFSSDGNLLIIGSCAAGFIVYDIFDTFSLRFWRKRSVGELLALGNDKSIEIVENKVGYDSWLVEIIDPMMLKALKMVIENPLETTNAQAMLDQEQINNSVLVKSRWSLLWNQICHMGYMLKSPQCIFSATVIAAIVICFKLIK